MERVECVVLGAGVIGLAVAAGLAEAGREVIVLEQHDCIGGETSSRNSEVIHAGIYYPLGSSKARLCVQGKGLLYDYCQRRGVPHKRCGKLIVAADAGQVPTVEEYIRKGVDNGVSDLVWLDQAEVHALEPEVEAVGAVLSPSTGIIDSHSFMLSLQGDLESRGGLLALNTLVRQVEHDLPTRVFTDDMTLCADWFINCAGLHAPQFAADTSRARQAFYAKGHYYSYSGTQPFRRLVYPVAEPGGLGVHVTLDLAGQVKFGPDVQWIDEPDYAFDDNHFDDFVSAIRRYYPALDARRLHPSYTGIRPKLAPAGAGFQDFCIQSEAHHGVAGHIDLLGIESPGLTASLAIAAEVVSLVAA